MRTIYLDNAATTPMRQEVLEAMLPYFCEQFGNPSSIYPLGQDASDAVAEARATIAGVLNAKKPEEVLAAENRTIPGTFDRATLSQVKERFSFLQKCRSRFDKAKFELEEASVIELDEI